MNIPERIALRLHARDIDPTQGAGEIQLLVDIEGDIKHRLGLTALRECLKAKLEQDGYVSIEDIDGAVNVLNGDAEIIQFPQLRLMEDGDAA